MTQLMTGESVARTAKKAGVHRCTIYAWLNENPTFRAHYERLHALLAEAEADRARELRAAALDAVEDSLCDPHTTPAVRLRAAIYVLGGNLNGSNAKQLPPDKIRHFFKTEKPAAQTEPSLPAPSSTEDDTEPPSPALESEHRGVSFTAAPEASVPAPAAAPAENEPSNPAAEAKNRAPLSSAPPETSVAASATNNENEASHSAAAAKHRAARFTAPPDTSVPASDSRNHPVDPDSAWRYPLNDRL